MIKDKEAASTTHVVEDVESTNQTSTLGAWKDATAYQLTDKFTKTGREPRGAFYCIASEAIEALAKELLKREFAIPMDKYGNKSSGIISAHHITELTGVRGEEGK